MTLPQGIRTVLQERLETAIEGGTIDLVEDREPTTTIEITVGELEVFLKIFFPEDWPEILEALAPTHTAPGTADRIQVYRDRAAKGESLYHPSDADPIRGDVDGRLIAAGKLALLIRQRANGSGPRVVGWAS